MRVALEEARVVPSNLHFCLLSRRARFYRSLMQSLALHERHQHLKAAFLVMNGMEAVAHYGDSAAEYRFLKHSVGVLDLSFRSRLCLLGADRKKFLHGQVTNQVNELQVGGGCYAALVTAKGRMQSDLNIYCLADELLLDFEPGLAVSVAQRLEKYIIADDVQVVDVQEPYGMLSVQGPQSSELIKLLDASIEVPHSPASFFRQPQPDESELYVMNQARAGGSGFDLFVPTASLGSLFDKIFDLLGKLGGGAVGWEALECARIEAGIPRFGADMDETNLPPEAGLEARAIHYAKGCYIGQETIARLRTYGQVAKALRGIRFAPEAQVFPKRGDKVYWSDKEIGHVTSATASPTLRSNVALAYLRREHNKVGDTVTVRSGDHTLPATVVTLPFEPFF